MLRLDVVAAGLVTALLATGGAAPRHHNTSTVHHFAAPVCTLGSVAPGHATPHAMLLPPTATSNDSLDLISIGAGTTGSKLVAAFRVASLTSAPGGQMMISGTQMSWFLDFKTPAGAYKFVGMTFGGALNAASTARSLTSPVPAVAGKSVYAPVPGPLFGAWSGHDSGTPGDPANFHIWDNYETGNVDQAAGTITVTAYIGDLATPAGSPLTNVMASTAEMDGGEWYQSASLTSRGAPAPPEYTAKKVALPSFVVGSAC